MKYWTQLNELDDAVYKVQAINSGLQILGRTDEMTSADSEMPEEFQTFLADLSDRMDEAVRDLKNKFQNVWDVVRDDTFEENMAAIDELEEDQNASKRFDQILSNLPTMNSTTDGYVIAGSMDDVNLTLNQINDIQFSFSDDNMNATFHSTR